eukprot:gnl/MRDRNA2_/MRDRNA2_73690_c0_seq3.p1 gnl/MRDRNA2_/MRDRNA2_73690_c0~~gnl/MRDRNA2_/MRDRNA2_73690_c0_seq3.p1  ORF type:complete len:122 (+),score=26.81 gnl/MRDRNA2_/MRDRNA2_73690_c0_seq3:223-588(+)
MTWAKVADWHEDLAKNTSGATTGSRSISLDSAITPAAKFDSKGWAADYIQSGQAPLNHHRELGRNMPDLVTSVDHPDFKRLQALQNWAGKADRTQFLIKGGRQIKAALDAGFPLIEIWISE